MASTSSTMSTNSAAEMYHILVAHILNDSIDVSELAEHHVVELQLGLFLDKINRLAKEYRKTFQYSHENSDVDGDFVKKLVQFSEFSRFVSFDDDKLIVELTPLRFQALLTGILVDSSIRYSRLLAREVDDLTEKYIELRPPVLATASLGGELSAIEEQPEITAKRKNEENGPETEAEDEEKSLEAANAETDEVKPDIESEERPSEEELERAQEAAAEAEDEAADDIDEEEQETNEVEKAEDEEHEKKESANDEQQQAGEPMEVDTEENKELPKSTSPEDVDMDGEAVGKGDSEEIGENAESDEGADEEVGAKPQVPRADDHKVETPAVLPVKEELISPPKRSLSPLVTSQKHKRFQNIAINLVKTIEEHRYLSPFLLPVVADQYDEVVFHPKDLKSILKAIKQKDEPAAYETVKELERDIMLMFANCVMYNKSSAHLVDMAKKMRDDVRITFKMFEDAESEIA